MTELGQYSLPKYANMKSKGGRGEVTDTHFLPWQPK